MVALVLLPGMDGTGQLFGRFLGALGSEVHAIAVSYPPAQVLDYSQLEAVVRSRLPSDQPFVLLGESFSGPIAVSIAASSPDGLRGLVLCCSFVKNPRPGLSVLKGLVDFLRVRGFPAAFLSRMLLGRLSSLPMRSSLARALGQGSPKVLCGRVRSVLGVNVASALSQVHVPLLYLRAGEDRVVQREAFGLISKLLPEARVIELEAPHFLLRAAPAEAARPIGAFVREVTVGLEPAL